MYVQITTKCNMRCDHCCFSCEPGKGENMSRKVWKQVLATVDDEYITLGGGEPTCHPDFERILMESIGQYYSVCVITNGKNIKRALLLAKLAQKRVVDAQVSLDDYHEAIDPIVVKAFRRLGKHQFNNTYIGVRNTTRISAPGAQGRAMETYYKDTNYDDIADKYKHCLCEDHMIKPNGDIMQCGCENSPIIGNVFDGWQSLCDEYDDHFVCCKKAVNNV